MRCNKMNEMQANDMSRNVMTDVKCLSHLFGRDADAGLGGLGKVFQIGVRVIGIGRRNFPHARRQHCKESSTNQGRLSAERLKSSQTQANCNEMYITHPPRDGAGHATAVLPGAPAAAASSPLHGVGGQTGGNLHADLIN